MPYDGPGIYEHYKGGRYEVVGLGFAERVKESGDGPHEEIHQQVVYRPLSEGSLLADTPVTFWLRGLKDFDAMVTVAPDLRPTQVPRFKRVGPRLALGRILQAEIGRLPESIVGQLTNDTDLDPHTRLALIDLVRVVRGIKDAFMAHLGELPDQD
jgi:hypothetical protein